MHYTLNVVRLSSTFIVIKDNIFVHFEKKREYFRMVDVNK